MTRLLCIALLLFAFSAGAASARGNDGGGGGGDVRVSGICARGATSSLRVRARDGGIEVRFALRQARGGGVWRITIVHENRVAFRATRRITRADDSLEIRRLLPDLRGSDTIAVHAWGPAGLGCRATGTLPDGR